MLFTAHNRMLHLGSGRRCPWPGPAPSQIAGADLSRVPAGPARVRCWRSRSTLGLQTQPSYHPFGVQRRVYHWVAKPHRLISNLVEKEKKGGLIRPKKKNRFWHLERDMSRKRPNQQLKSSDYLWSRDQKSNTFLRFANSDVLMCTNDPRRQNLRAVLLHSRAVRHVGTLTWSDTLKMHPSSLVRLRQILIWQDWIGLKKKKKKRMWFPSIPVLSCHEACCLYLYIYIYISIYEKKRRLTSSLLRNAASLRTPPCSGPPVPG